jgi:hypothetical protein
MQQFQTTRKWRENNRLIELYETIEAEHFEETRKLVSISHSPQPLFPADSDSTRIGQDAVTRMGSPLAGLRSSNSHRPQ